MMMQQMMNQMSESWHRTGLFMGMHWLWWLFWILALAMILWAFWRIHADRAEQHQGAMRQESAEEQLRARFAAGEIDEDEYARRLRILRETNFGS